MTMLLLPELFCPECRGYAHPFLDRCAGCGGPRLSRYADALTDRPDEPTLTDDPRFDRTAREASTKVAFWGIRGRLGVMGREGVGGAPAVPTAGPTVGEIADRVASQLTYRVAGFDGGEPVDVDLRIEGGSLAFRDRKGRAVATIDPALVLAAVPVEAREPDPQLEGVDDKDIAPATRPHFRSNRLVVSWRAADGRRKIAVGNRSGFFTTQARLGHYIDLAWWIGVLAAASAQSRWRSVGARAHAVEIGLEALLEFASETGPRLEHAS